MPRGEQISNKTYFKIGYENNDKDNGKPFFSEQKKQGNEWISVSQDTFLEGELIGVSKSSYEYKNKLQHVFELLIDGGDENYALQLNYGYFTRSILNSLASVPSFGNVKIRLEIWRNKDGYVTVVVKYDTQERIDWLLPNDKLPKLDDEKWLGSFDYFIGVISGNIPKKEKSEDHDPFSDEALSQEQKFAEQKAEQQAPPPDEEDDLPFNQSSS